ncbi:MAG: tRNA (adenosine(37)-N6)-threonylcarbamoyltransferase complex dimerization subunit type 1 TsaB [Tissierellaceae bacterium]|nr:tRNA (adenosine(37)-N6)-threonylcarbamoyltransferase complex dimerization subunit type 1 TsaB [Tissierellaceae bacterium]
MRILGLDTSTMMTTCAVIDDEKVLGEYSLNQDMTHSEKLVPMIKVILDNLNLKIKDIDLYGVALGPGSFTGLRIGAATMKSFAHLFDKPIVGISTLEALAYNLPYNEIVVPMIDARRNRVYTGIYTWEDGILKELMAPDVIEIDELILKLKDFDEVVVNGNGTFLYKDKIQNSLGSKVKFATIGQNMCRATSICELAKIKYEKGEVDNYFTLAPEYLRESQAQRELNERKDKNS